MASRLNEKTREALFVAWCEKPDVKAVAKKFSLCRKTIEKYRRIDNWDKRLEDIRLKARARSDYDIVEERRKNLKLIRAAKAVYAQQLQSDKLKGKVRLGDINDLIRLELLLVGEPDSRPDVGIPDAIRHLADSDLRILIAGIESRIGKKTSS